MRTSLAKFHPEVPHFVFIVGSGGSKLPTPRNGETLIRAETVIPDEIKDLITFYYDPLELCCALKPLVVSHVLATSDAEYVAYLDSDLFFYSPFLEHIIPPPGKSVAVTPHYIQPALTGWRKVQQLREGFFNAGFFCVSRSQKAGRFLDDWWKLCQTECTRVISESHSFLDQSWLSLLTQTYHEDVASLDHAGLNVAFWNFHEREVHLTDDDLNAPRVKTGLPLIFIHWSNLVPYCANLDFGGRDLELLEPEELHAIYLLSQEYKNELNRQEKISADRIHYSYGYLADGTEIPYESRSYARFLLRSGILKESNLFLAGRQTIRDAVKARRSHEIRVMLRAFKNFIRTFSSARRNGKVRSLLTIFRYIVLFLIRYRIKIKPRSKRTIDQLATLYRSDKGTKCFFRHGYTLVYDRVFAPLRAKPITLLEIGLKPQPHFLTKSRQTSLSIWRDYFPNGMIYGLDVIDFSDLSRGNVKIFQGDQGNIESLKATIREANEFDIVIDNGSHASYHQKITFETLYPAVKPGGYYIIEDLHFQPPELEETLPATPKILALLRDRTYLATSGIRQTDVSFHCRDKLVIVRKR